MPEVFEGTLEDDINRRDFSINSILYNISQKSFIDLKNGIKDIKDGIIRTTSNPKIIFAEDPLRIMRAIRFAAQLGFKIEENTFNNIIKFVPWLKNISNERIRDEFNKILISKYFVDGINYLNYSGILSYMISEFSKFDSIQNEDCKWHTKNLFNHTLEVMTRVPATIEHRLAALLHDVGKVNTMTINNTGIHFYQHQFHSQRIAKNFMIHYKYTNKQIEWISNSIMMHMNFIEKMSEKTIRKMINKYGKEQFLFFLDLAMADSLRPERKYIVQSIIDFVNTNKYIPEVITKMPVNGDMIMKRYNLKPSKIVGELLAIEKEFLFEFPEANEFEIYYILDNKIVNNK
jgi:tRNA nucleotidyltransferase (CCA-adding enzyme)